MPKTKSKEEEFGVKIQVKTKEDVIADTAFKMMYDGMKFKEPRMKDIEKNVEAYINKVKPPLPGRFNIPVPTMSGMVDEVLAKIDDAPKLIFKHIREEDLRKAKKITAQWNLDNVAGRWTQKDRLVKKLAILSGRGIYKIYSDNLDGYKNHLDVVHYKDFFCEPLGGSYLEDHLFLGQTNLWRTDWDLQNGGYDKELVNKIKLAYQKKEFKTVQQEYSDTLTSFTALGLETQQHTFVGQNIYNLTEMGLVYEGKRWYCLFETRTGQYLKVVPWEEVFESGLWDWVSFATHEDPKNFWSKGYADDWRHKTKADRVLLNQELDNRQKRNWGQKLFNADVISEPGLLEYRPDGLIPVIPKQGQSIRDTIHIVETPELNGTLGLLDWLENRWNKNTGVQASQPSKGSQKSKVGIYYGELQAVADRMGLINKSYSEAYHDLGVRYDWGLYENMDEEMLIKFIGMKGVEWDELRKEDVEPEFDLNVVGANAETQADEIKKKTKFESVLAVKADPELRNLVSKKWMAEQILNNGGWEEEELKVAFDTQNEGNQEILSEAAEGIQLILEGKEAPNYRNATQGFVQKILDFAYDHQEDEETFNKLLEFAIRHLPISLSNMVRRTQMKMALQGKSLGNVLPPQQPELPQQVPGTPEGTQALSQQTSGTLTP